MEPTHYVFSDESSLQGCFSSICLVSIPKEDLEVWNDGLNYLLANSDMSEFKWSRLRDARSRFGAIKFIDFVLKNYHKLNFRIDILVWDNEQRKTAIPERDNVMFSKMYHHVWKNVLKMRWDPQNLWTLFPDEHCETDWDEILDILNATATNCEVEKNNDGSLGLKFLKEFSIVDISEKTSMGNPLIQLADLFAGIGAYTHNEPGWANYDVEQTTLFGRGDIHKKNSERYRVLSHFRSLCKEKELPISTSKEFKTYDPKSKINFWVFKQPIKIEEREYLLDLF